MKHLLILCLWLISIGWFAASDASAQAATHSTFNAGGVPDIHPAGWLHTLMQRQHDGLTGHPEALSYPYNSCLWAGEISRSDESYGDNWWRYEQTAYYTDGLLRLGYELNADEMVTFLPGTNNLFIISSGKRNKITDEKMVLLRNSSITAFL